MYTISNLISALIIVESSGNDMAIGDHGKAIGPLQIHKAVVLDVNKFTGSHYRHQDMTNRAQARAVCEAYLRHYGKGAGAVRWLCWGGGYSGLCQHWRPVCGTLRWFGGHRCAAGSIAGDQFASAR